MHPAFTVSRTPIRLRGTAIPGAEDRQRKIAGFDQEIFSASSVVCIGAGGIISQIAPMLVRKGIGKIALLEAIKVRGSLSDAARSLVADFAGARADIAERRKRGETTVRRANVAAAATSETLPLEVAPPPGTLYHVGTLRGGQALHHAGNIVVIGDVNPGTELVATGDIVVFGRLLGVAHAGAQGDNEAKVYALDMQATQLRIATVIAVDEDHAHSASEPEVAFVRDGRITIAPFSKAAEVAG